MHTAHLILTIYTNNKSTRGYSCPFASHRQFNDALPQQVTDNLVTSANSTNFCLYKLSAAYCSQPPKDTIPRGQNFPLFLC